MIATIVVIALSVAGFLIAHYIHRKKTAHKPVVCPMKGSCDAVIESDFSRFLGIPVEVLGMAYYGVIALAYIVVLVFDGSIGAWLVRWLLAVSFSAVLFSIYLTFVQILSIKHLCTWCLTSAGLSVGVFVAAIIGSFVDVRVFLAASEEWVLLIHLLSMALGLGAATIADLLFLKFLRDFRISEFESNILQTMSQILWVSLSVILISGAGLAIPQMPELLDSSKFLAKMIVVSVIIVNGALLNLLIAPKLVRISFALDHKHHPGELRRTRQLVFVLGPVSFISWYSAFFLGALREISWSFPQLIAVYGIALVLGMVGGQLVERRILVPRDPAHPLFSAFK